jgi:uncharacterized protein (DUF305 family)
VQGASFDRAFLTVMIARHRKALRMAGFEARDGGVPEVRALARQMIVELETQLRQMTAWKRAWPQRATRTS